MASVSERVRKALESRYDDVCTVYEYIEVVKDNNSTGHEERAVFEELPCRLSYENLGAVRGFQSDTADITEQIIKLFLAPEYDIKPGSKISVKRLGRDLLYKSAGKSRIYPSHQEVVLELYEEKA